MLTCQHNNRSSFRISGLLVVCCLIAAFVFGYKALSAHTASSPVAYSVAASSIFKSASTVHRSPANTKSHGHFSPRNEQRAKVIMKDGVAAILSSVQPRMAMLSIASIAASYSMVVTPGYYLFLFRYALF